MSSNYITRVRLSAISMSYLTRRSPWAAVWWSVALPGFGHMYLGQYVKGMVLMSWEILVNHRAHLNLAIYYTLLGQPELAGKVLDYHWLIVYPLFYLFAMFDAYRQCLEINELTALERTQRRRRFDRINSGPLGLSMLTRRNPFMAGFWSACITGMGQLYNDRGLKALSLMGWYLAVVLQSGISLAAFYTLTGRYELVPEALDYQWLLFWPSIYMFGVADAYCDAATQNSLHEEAFRWRLRKYVRNGG